MRLFLTNELGRLSYLLVLLAMIGFDLAKPHIEGYAARLGDNVSMSAFEDSRGAAPQAAAPRKLPSFDKLGSSPSLAPGAVNGDGPILQFSTQMMAAREKARAEGRELTEGATRHLAFNVLKGLPGNERATEKIATVAAGQSIMPLVVLLLTAVTVPVLIWMVTGRVRDIGWSQGVAYAVLGLFFLPKFMAVSCRLAFSMSRRRRSSCSSSSSASFRRPAAGGSATVSPSTISMCPQTAAPDAVSSANAASSEFCWVSD